MEGDVSSKYHKSRRSIIKIGLGARKICRNVFKISMKKDKILMLMGKKIKYLCSWEIEKRQNTHAQGNKYTFSALREKVIYLNTYETWMKRNY